MVTIDHKKELTSFGGTPLKGPDGNPMNIGEFIVSNLANGVQADGGNSIRAFKIGCRMTDESFDGLLEDSDAALCRQAVIDNSISANDQARGQVLIEIDKAIKASEA